MKTHNRRAFTAIEMLTAFACLSLLLAIAVPTVTKLARQRRAVESHLELVESATNMMERIVHLPYSEIDSEKLEAQKLAENLPQQHRSIKLKIVVKEITDKSLDGKKIHLHLLPEPIAGQAQRPVKLTSWVFSKKAEQ